jgi:gliding motility-associated protein GldE
LEDPEPYTSILFLLSVLKPVEVPAVIGLVSLLLLIIGSALISGSEVAYFSLNPNQLHDLKSEQSSISKMIIRHLERSNYLLATILISNNFINVAIVILSTYLTGELFDFEQLAWWVVVLIQVVAVTSLILIFGEIMPKMLATQQPVGFARFMARPLELLYRLFYQISTVLVKSTTLIERRLSNRKNENLTRDELSEAIEIAVEEGVDSVDEKQILKGIVKFGDIDTKEIMRSRVDVTAVDKDTTFTELVRIIVDSGYSRIPVYEESFDNVLGILYVKDLIPHLTQEDDFGWVKLVRPAFFVPENKAINDLLKDFQNKKIHMAIVVDEYGGTSGIITLEDVLEEIVGEISDEFDQEEDAIDYEKVSANKYLFEGKTTINDFCKLLKIDDRIFDEVKGESDTLAGLILESLGEIPTEGEFVKQSNFIFKVNRADTRRIIKVEVEIENGVDSEE